MHVRNLELNFFSLNLLYSPRNHMEVNPVYTYQNLHFVYFAKDFKTRTWQ